MKRIIIVNFVFLSLIVPICNAMDPSGSSSSSSSSSSWYNPSTWDFSWLTEGPFGTDGQAEQQQALDQVSYNYATRIAEQDQLKLKADAHKHLDDLKDRLKAVVFNSRDSLPPQSFRLFLSFNLDKIQKLHEFADKEDIRTFLWEAYILFCKYPKNAVVQEKIQEFANIFGLNVQINFQQKQEVNEIASEQKIRAIIAQLKQAITNKYGPISDDQIKAHFKHHTDRIESYKDNREKMHEYKKLIKEAGNFIQYHFTHDALKQLFSHDKSSIQRTFMHNITDTMANRIRDLEKQIKDQNQNG